MKTKAEEIASGLIEVLWKAYMKRVPPARKFVRLAEEMEKQVILDHIAFRSLNTTTGEQPAGITAFSHLFTNLGYIVSGSYRFEKQKVKAIHLEHPGGKLPLIYISEVETGALPGWTRPIIHGVVDECPYLISDNAIELMNYLSADGAINEEAAELLIEELSGYFRRPWEMPSVDEMLKINDVSQYTAWVLLHGNTAAHFAALVQPGFITGCLTLEDTLRIMTDASVQMNKSILGGQGSLLRQAASIPTTETYRFPAGGDFTEMPWTYSYFELVERGYTEKTSGREMFTGFIADHSARMFKLTHTTEN